MNRSERREQDRQIDKLYGIPKSQKIETKNTFGCEVSNDYIPKNQMELLRKIGLQNIIKVKRRKNGMTSSMKSGGCHSNVRILVERCGGKQLLGYMICGGGGLFDTEQNGEEPFQMVYHSVWITPEGKCKDITNNYDDRDGMDEDCIIRKGDKEYILFVPIGLGLIEELGVCVNGVELCSDWEMKGVIIKTLSTNKPYHFPINLFDRFLKKYGLIGKGIIKTGRIPIKSLKECVDYGGFSQKSLGTGKYWDEIKTEIVW